MRGNFIIFVALSKLKQKITSMSEERSLHFLEEIIEADLKNGTHGGRVLTRFPQSQMVICTLAMPNLFV